MTANRKWTAAEVNEMGRMFASGMTDKAVGEKLGRTAASVRRKRQDTGITRDKPEPKHPKPGQLRIWKARQLETVRKMYHAGKSDFAIGEAIGKSAMAVAKQRARHGITGEPPRRRVAAPREVVTPKKRPNECPLTIKTNDNKARDAMAAALERGEGVEGAMLAVMRLRGLAA